MIQTHKVLACLTLIAGLPLVPTQAAAQSGTVTDDAFLSSNAVTQLVNLNGQGISLIGAGSNASVGKGAPLLANKCSRINVEEWQSG